jgi:hypothetical protein
MVVVLLPTLEYLSSWLIAERPHRDPAAVVAKILARHGRRLLMNLGADRGRGADPLPGSAKKPIQAMFRQVHLSTQN